MQVPYARQPLSPRSSADTCTIGRREYFYFLVGDMENNAPVLDQLKPHLEPPIRPPASRPVPESQRPTLPPQPKRKRPARKFFATIGIFLAAALVASELTAVAHIWLTPSRTSYMRLDGEPIIYQYVSLDHVSRYMIAETIAHEDQDLGTRAGAFHPEELWARATAHLGGKEDPSSSTIPQQLAKNIFLWPEQSALRKALEAVLATELSLTLSDQRIMELYLNYAEFGPRLYGVCAATWYYYNTPPWNMTEYQAAQLIRVLPNPKAVERAKEGGIYRGPVVNYEVWEYVHEAANVWVPKQIEGMGGSQAAVATIGIADTAVAHTDKPSNQDACSTMPKDVADRITVESGN